jgi:glycosyltransferase involved in cell wall biosynthesis
MPIIEGQKTGRVVVTSIIEPLIEVSGYAVAYVDLYDLNSIRLGFLKVIKDDAYRIKKIALGIENVEQFSVRKIAKEYVEIYKEI